MRFGFDFLPEDVTEGGSGSGSGTGGTGGTGDTPQATASAGYVDQVQDKNGDIYDIQDTQARSDIADLVSANFLKYASIIFGNYNDFANNDQVTVVSGTSVDANSLSNGLYYVSSEITNYPFTQGYLISTNGDVQIAICHAYRAADCYIAIRYKITNTDYNTWRIIGESADEYNYIKKLRIASAYLIESNSSTATDNPNLNNYKTPGTYYGQGSRLPQNFPSNVYNLQFSSDCNYKLVVSKYAFSFIKQTLYTVMGTSYVGKNPYKFERTCISGTWGPWVCTSHAGLAADTIANLNKLTTPGLFVAEPTATGAPADIASGTSDFTVEVQLRFSTNPGTTTPYSQLMQIARLENTVYIRYANQTTQTTPPWSNWAKITAT